MTHQKCVIRVAAEEWVPYTKLHEVNGTLVVSGPMENFLHEFSRFLAVSYVLLRPPDGMWGSSLPNGSTYGMIRMLQQGEVDFALGPFIADHWREQVVDLSASFYQDSYVVLSPRPVLTSDPAGLAKTFTPLVWSLVVASLVAVGVTLAGLTWATERRERNIGVSRVSWAGLWTFQGLFQQSTWWLPEHTSSRVLVATWMVSGLVIMSVYRGVITAMLMLPKITIPIDSIADLAAQKDIPWKLEVGDMQRMMLESEEASVRKVGAGLRGFIPSCWAARQDIGAGKFAAICDRTSVATIMSWDFSTTGRCHFYMARHPMVTSWSLTLAFPTNSSLLPKANNVAMRLTEAGLWDAWLANQLTNTSECLKPPVADRGARVKPLGLQDILGLLALLALGFWVAAVAFMLEQMVWYVSATSLK